MIEYILRILYKTHKKIFYSLIAEEFFGDIPPHIKEPSIEFLANGKDVLERFFSIQAYQFKKRAALDKRNGDFYEGALVMIRAMLVAVHSLPKPLPKAEFKKPDESWVDNLKVFRKMASNLTKKNKQK